MDCRGHGLLVTRIQRDGRRCSRMKPLYRITMPKKETAHEKLDAYVVHNECENNRLSCKLISYKYTGRLVLHGPGNPIDTRTNTTKWFIWVTRANIYSSLLFPSQSRYACLTLGICDLSEDLFLFLLDHTIEEDDLAW